MLSSAEVGTLITALGCGIGRQEFDLSKLRYHRIIIMTDADVDGSHIRTLLLTFFYRQMPELVENGHIYIAQPPLYKIKKGKQERYVKDDGELNNYLLQLAIENAELHVNAEAPSIAGTTLETLARQYQAVMATIERLSKRYHAGIIEKMIYMPAVTDAMLEQPEALKVWFEEMISWLNANEPSGTQFRVTFELNAETSALKVIIIARSHGVENSRLFPLEFFQSADYKSFVALGDQLRDLLEENAYVKRGDRQQEISSFKDALFWLIQEARRGQHIQRYKGLGEMNPAQLWETTLDVNARRLLQVKIEDAVAADEIFTTLMGDQVEPRREFIESNALDVVNLDI